MKALYRKYRPLKLSEVVGEPQVTGPLENSLKSGKISHAYLFIGPRGCGKTSVARIFAHEINGFKYETEDNYVDIIEIDAASNTGIDNIRELKERAMIAPTEGKYKVYIIDEIHMLSKSAFNALLKLLEEPPRHVIFIMATTDAYKVLPTIISRSQVYNFKLVDEDVMLPLLQKIAKSEKIKITDDALKVIIRRGGGSFRDTISLLDQISSLKTSEKITENDIISALGLPKEQAIDELLDAYEAGKLAELSERLRNLLNSGARAETVAEEIIARILKNPTPPRLGLLKTLPDVSAPFADAKLLLALTEHIATAPARVIGNARGGHEKATGNEDVVDAEDKSGVQQRAGGTLRNASAPTTSSLPTIDFNWQTYVTAVTETAPTLGDRLEKCLFELTENILKIYPEKRVFTNILKSKNNLSVLEKHLPRNLSLEIKTPDEITPELLKSSPNAKLSDIMGLGIQEVKDGGDIPF